MLRKILRYIGPVVGIGIFAAAIYLLYRELRAYDPLDILRHIASLPTPRILAALGCGLASYMAVTVYDALGARFAVGKRLSYWKTARAAFASTSISNSAGFGLLTGGSVRYRMYSGWGLAPVEIGKIIGFYTLSLWLGFFALGGALFTVETVRLPASLHIPFPSARPLGILFLCVIVGYAIVAGLKLRGLRLGKSEISLPGLRILPAQIAVGVADWGLAGLSLYIVLSATTDIPYGEFMAIYVLSLIGGIVSQVPGGIGVFETVFVLLLQPRMPAPQVLGAVLVFRGVYYLVPLVLGLGVLAAEEIAAQRERLQKAGRALTGVLSAIMPPLLAACIFAGGIVLLVSGATPAEHTRLLALRELFPLPFIETTHLLGSVVGILMLFVARGVLRRIDSAWLMSVVLLVAGIVLSLAKGLDYEEALVLLALLLAALPSRRLFYRKSSILNGGLPAAWAAGIVTVVIAIGWVTLYAHRHVEFSGELVWQFILDAHAPRSIRALAGATVAALAVGATLVIRPAATSRPSLPEPDAETVSSIVRGSKRASANLAFLGDKLFLVNEARTAFLMYGISGRTWVSMGDPVGHREEAGELAWRFRELGDRHGARAVFYEVGPESLPVYLEMGYTLLNLGEEARVPLEGFSLEGSARKDIRHPHTRCVRDGHSFELVPPERVPELLPVLRGISDAWLESKKTREKGFAMGSFSEEYMKRFPVGLIRRDGREVAFATLWRTDEREELSIDLMRHSEGAGPGVMEYLFAELMLWGSSQGYRWFNLGVAPLSGIEDHELAPLWNRVTNLIYRYGGYFYNFQGLRFFKAKFGPVWEPRYIAAPGGIAVPRVVVSIAALVAGGVRGVVAR